MLVNMSTGAILFKSCSGWMPSNQTICEALYNNMTN